MVLDDTIAILAGTPVLEHFDRDALRLIAITAEFRKLAPGETLFREGDRSDGGYAVLSGTVEATRAGSDETVIAGSSALVGRLALFLRMPRASTVEAREAAVLLRVSPTLMRRVLEGFPQAAARIHDALAADLGDLGVGLERVRSRLLAIDDRSETAPVTGPARP